MIDGKRVRLTVDARMISHSGIGKYLQMLLPFIIKEFDVTLLGVPEQLDKFASGAKVITFTSPIYSINEQIQLCKLISAVDIFWSPHYNVPLLGLRSAKRIVTIHDVFHLAHYNELNFAKRLYAKYVINKAIQLSDKIITVSEFSKLEIIKYTRCKPEKIQVIYNGVKQVPIIKQVNAVIEKYNLPARYILFVGNVKPHKNLTKFFMAYILLNNDLRNEYKIVIVGKKEGFISGDVKLFEWIDTTPILKENVIFTGFVDEDDMDSIYSNASLFVFPSVYEGFGLPPLEAMLNSSPVIASNTSCIPEVCGPAALYFDPQNETDICNKITEVLTDNLKKNQLIEKGLDRIKLFRWKDSADKHVRIFNRLIEN